MNKLGDPDNSLWIQEQRILGSIGIGIPEPMVVNGGEVHFTTLNGLRNKSGQIIATSHDLTPNGGLVREIPLFQGNPDW